VVERCGGRPLVQVTYDAGTSAALSTGDDPWGRLHSVEISPPLRGRWEHVGAGGLGWQVDGMEQPTIMLCRVDWRLKMEEVRSRLAYSLAAVVKYVFTFIRVQ
jgi:hypothetical protein